MAKRVIHIKPGESVEIRVSEKDEKDYYTVQEVADKVGLNYYTVQKHIADGKLIGNKIGRSHRISKENYQKYLKNQ